jgi:hypothetical protein
MSVISTPTSVPEVLDLLDDMIDRFGPADFTAMSDEALLKYIEALDWVIAISSVVQVRLLAEYIRRRWDGTVRWAYYRPITGSPKVTWSGVRAARKS